MSSSRSLLLAALALAALTACDKLRPLANEGSSNAQCTACHGYPPPPGIVTDAAAHPNNTNCHACHPGTMDANGNLIPASAGGLHQNGKIDVMGGHQNGFDDPAVHGPQAIADLASCQACHGTDFAGGSVGVSCNACHDQHGFGDWQTNCTFCHGTRTASYAGGANPVKAAPPVDVSGETATTAVGVGAHQSHLSSTIIAGGLACSACHAVPTDLAHVQGQPATNTFSTFAGGATASFDAGTARCSNVYCHGATLGGGSATSPRWTLVDGSQSTCDSCHGAPPASPHPTSTISGCVTCHAESVDGSGKILSGGKHLDGNVDATSPHPANWAGPTQHGYSAEASSTSLASCTGCHAHQNYTSCTSCHGGVGFSDWQTNCTFCHGTQTQAYTAASLVKAAPPEGVHGETLATNAHVGAHQRHLAATTYANPIACATCHAVPADLSHITGTPTTTFSGVAAGTTWNGTTCTTYCHGATLPTGSGGGGSNETPSWTQSGVACNWCHSTNPTTGQHPAVNSKHSSFQCSTCHGTGYSSTAVVKATHVNRTVDLLPSLNFTITSGQKSCNPACHGSENW